jgi:hypothetical protein
MEAKKTKKERLQVVLADAVEEGKTPRCCDRPMRRYDHTDMFTQGDISGYVCMACGSFQETRDGQYDIEDAFNIFGEEKPEQWDNDSCPCVNYDPLEGCDNCKKKSAPPETKKKG